MANREALRELQGRLADRLQAVRTQPRARSWLAVEAAGCGFLFPLAQAGEIFSLPMVLPVPHSQPWFMGVANLRGGLHGVVDLARFIGVGAAAVASTGRDSGRVVALNPSLGVNCALYVDALAGLRSQDQLSLEPAAPGARPAFVGERLCDAAGRAWQELDLAALAADEAFIGIVGR